MSQLTANIVFATWNALPEDEKQEFRRLIDKAEGGTTKKKRPLPEKYRGIEEKYLPGNEHLLAAELAGL